MGKDITTLLRWGGRQKSTLTDYIIIYNNAKKNKAHSPSFAENLRFTQFLYRADSDVTERGISEYDEPVKS